MSNIFCIILKVAIYILFCNSHYNHKTSENSNHLLSYNSTEKMSLTVDTSFIPDLPKGPLDTYRSRAKFDWKKLRLIFEDSNSLKIKVWFAFFFTLFLYEQLNVKFPLVQNMEHTGGRPIIRKTKMYFIGRRTETSSCNANEPNDWF